MASYVIVVWVLVSNFHTWLVKRQASVGFGMCGVAPGGDEDTGVRIKTLTWRPDAPSL